METDNPLLILHLSDLHFGEHSRFSDRDPKELGELFVRSLQQERKRRSIEPEVALVVVTGDIAEAARDREYEQAELFFRAMGAGLGLSPERFVFVPGNHDVSWNHCKRVELEREQEDFDDAELNRRIEAQKLVPYKAFLERFRGDAFAGDIGELEQGGVIHDFPDLRLSVVALNSCERESHLDHVGAVSEAQAQAVMDRWAGGDRAWTRLVAVHHNPLSMPPGAREQWREYVRKNGGIDAELAERFAADLAGMEGSEHLRRLVSHGEVTALLHGHQHEENKEIWGWERGDGQGYLLAAGSAGVGEVELPGRQENHFQLILLDRPAGRLRVCSLTYNPKATSENRIRSGAFVADGARPECYQKPLHSPVGEPSVVPAPVADAVPLAPPAGREARGLFGREGEVERLLKMVNASPVVCLYGMAGIGKSALIEEVLRRRGDGGEGYRFAVREGMAMSDLYEQLAPALGCRQERAPAPQRERGRHYFPWLKEWAASARPVTIHLEHVHRLFGENAFKDPAMVDLLEAVADHCPKARIVLESRRSPPEGLLRQAARHFDKLRLNGLDQEAVAAYFRHPFAGRDAVRWALSEGEAERVFVRLGGKGGKKKKGLALPLAMVLLATVAEGLAESPPRVLDRHPEALGEKIEEQLFGDLYDAVLSEGERHVLKLCALYRDEIPYQHADPLNEAAGDPTAFNALFERCLLNAGHHQERFYLNGVIAERALARLDDAERREGHAVIGQAWQARLARGAGATLPNITAAGESVHQLLQAERYDLIDPLVAKLLRGNRDLEGLLAGLSKRLHDAGRHREDLSVLQLLVAVAPDNSKAQCFLGEALERRHGRGHDEALEHYFEAYRLSDHPANVADIGRCLAARDEHGRFRELIDAMEEGDREHYLKNEHVYAIYAAALAEEGDEATASALRRERMRAGSKNAAYYADEAVRLLGKKEFAAALEVVALARRNGAYNDHLTAIHARILEGSGEGGEASRLRWERIKARSRNPVFYNDEACRLRDTGKPAEARKLLERAIAEGVDDDATHHILRGLKG
ncbi:metallophosphoesterase [Endothiovibrio diazotrophicus]